MVSLHPEAGVREVFLPFILLFALSVLVYEFPSACAPGDRREGAGARGRYFLGVTDLSGWMQERDEGADAVRLLSPPFSAPIAWNELVISWNTAASSDMGLKVEARALYPEHATRWYTLGMWTLDSRKGLRESVNGQRDADGEVLTDTLVLKRPAERVQVRLTLSGAGPKERTMIKFLALSFADTRAKLTPLEPDRSAWGRVIEVPERAQGDYPDPSEICSPTSTSMTLSYWAKRLNRPELDRDVPEVKQGVHDPKWPGWGNWPFNTAYAGAFPGMRAYVARLSDISELEAWIAAGIPVIVSVSHALWHGAAKANEGGHIVVVTGFTDKGDPIINDPAFSPRKGHRVRRVYPRENLRIGWSRSHNTVYLIYPENASIPTSRYGHWEQSKQP
jgi:uncharacterized protein YvpB